MNSETLKARTKAYSISIAKLIIDLPHNVINKNYSNQLIRSSSSVGANYRAACRAKSSADFLNKLKIVEEELDETMFFLELLAEFNAEKGRLFKKIGVKPMNYCLLWYLRSLLFARKSKSSKLIVNRNSKIVNQNA